MKHHPRVSAKLSGLGGVLAAGVLALISLVAASPSTSPPGGQVNADLTGDWSVTYGSPAVVTISGSNSSYSVVAKGPLQVSRSSCFLPSGTLIATFSGSAGKYTGQHGLWNAVTCRFAQWDPMTLTFDGDRLTAVLAGLGDRPIFTRVGPAPAVPRAGPPFRESVPTPAVIASDPLIVLQSLAIAAGIMLLVPFPAILFNRTLEENYP